jgi:hypothetical protein
MFDLGLTVSGCNKGRDVVQEEGYDLRRGVLVMGT